MKEIKIVFESKLVYVGSLVNGWFGSLKLLLISGAVDSFDELILSFDDFVVHILQALSGCDHHFHD